MSTLTQLTDRVISHLQGMTRDQDERTWITSAITDTDLAMTVQEPKLISQGLAEIGDELLWVSRTDNSSGAVTIAPFGRGYQSTTAASHAENTAVVNSPKFPRSSVKSAINETISGIYPDLYVVANHEFPYVAARSTYELPAAADQVIGVKWQTIGPTKRWAALTRWDWNPQADTDEFTTGKSIDLLQEPISGRTIRVTYIKPPSAFIDDDTEFASATGLSASAQDCVVYGTCFRLVGLLESSRLQLHSIEATIRSQQVPPGSTQSAARHFLQLYQLSLQSERERLLRANPTSTHFRYI